jgi:hypothetical protein
MGLSKDFKKFVKTSMSSVVVAEEPEADAVLLDAPCVLHAFSVNESDSTPGALQLLDKVRRAALYGCSAEGTVVVCFDRQAETPVHKGLAHGKRRKAQRVWTRQNVQDLLDEDALPLGDEWADLLASREVRSLVTDYVGAKLLEWHVAGGHKFVRRLIVHNSREAGGALISTGEVKEEPSGPRAGEADVAMAAWAVWLASEDPKTRILVRTVDTDTAAILAVHVISPCVLSFTHYDPKHRMCVDILALRRVLAGSYGLTPREFAAVAIAKGTDFAETSLRGLPDWHTTLRLCGSFIRAQKIFAESGEFEFNNFARMLSSVALHAKRAKVAPMTPEHRGNVEFNVGYWTSISDCFPKSAFTLPLPQVAAGTCLPLHDSLL